MVSGAQRPQDFDAGLPHAKHSGCTYKACCEGAFEGAICEGAIEGAFEVAFEVAFEECTAAIVLLLLCAFSNLHFTAARLNLAARCSGHKKQIA